MARLPLDSHRLIIGHSSNKLKQPQPRPNTKTLRVLPVNPEPIPMSASWYLTDLAEAKGKQELFTKQAPQRLKVLREHALIESAVSSNRIEGVNIDKSRIKPVILGIAHLRYRNEEEVRGYRDALNMIHEEGINLPITGETTLKLHKLTRVEIWDAESIKRRMEILSKDTPMVLSGCVSVPLGLPIRRNS